MERLTERFDGLVMRKGCHGPCRTCNGCECADIYPMIDRLAAYEDTGLEPEDINRSLKTLDLFTEATKNVPLNRIRELSQAEKDGRLVVLPCKVGDAVYEANNRGFISTYKVISIRISDCSVLIGWELIDGIYSNLNGFELSALGKTVFLTREEAEAALEKREETDMDYKELIEELRMVASWDGVCFDCNQCVKAATAFETLLAEREAAVEEMHGRCIKCKHFSVGILDFPCTDCRYEGGANDHWQWRGPQKGGDG